MFFSHYVFELIFFLKFKILKDSHSKLINYYDNSLYNFK